MTIIVYRISGEKLYFFFSLFVQDFLHAPSRKTKPRLSSRNSSASIGY